MKQIDNGTETWELDNGKSLTGIHNREDCVGKHCVFHNQSDNHMSDWYLHWRDDRGIFERICKHNVGHPDIDQFEYWEAMEMTYLKIHGCDGCCYG